MAVTPEKTLLVLAACLFVLLGYFLVERILLSRRLRRIPLRICVTGTRGKSTVARLIASTLREAGFTVMAKTTGSKPVVIFPDGTEKEIVRRGKPSILEQKKILKLAVRTGAQALVAEMMSIRPECMRVESVKIFGPRVLAVTNVRLDHLDDMGRIKSEIAASLAAAVPENGTVFIPEEEFYPVFQETAEKGGSRVVRVSQRRLDAEWTGRDFPENIRLTLAVAEFLGIREDVTRACIEKARPDFGGLKIWKIPAGDSGRERFLVSAFAANEPESTGKVLEILRRKIPDSPRKLIALLNLRADRGDRTEQWLRAFNEGFFDSFERIVLAGDQTKPLSKKMANNKCSKAKVSTIPRRQADRVTAELLALAGEGGVVVGMGNMGGLGAALIDHWAGVGVPA